MSAAARIFRAFESEPAKAEAIVDALDAYQERKDALTRAEFQKETWEIRAEIEKVRAETEKVRAEIEKVRADVEKGRADVERVQAALQLRMAEIHSDLQIQIEKVRADVEKVRADLRTEIEKVRADLHQAINRQVIWIIVAVSVMIGILKGLDILLK